MPALDIFIFSVNFMRREDIAMSVVPSGSAEIPTPLPPPVTVMAAEGFSSI